MAAALLARAPRKPAPGTYFSAAGAPVVQGSGCTALIAPSGNVDLRHFPSGGCIDSLYVPERILGMAWAEGRHVVGLALRGPTERNDKIQLAEFPITGPTRKWVCNALLNGEAHSIALSPRLDPAVGAHKFTGVFSLLPGGVDAKFKALLVHEDWSPGLVTIFPTEFDVCTGTRAGNVYRWDLRSRGTRPVSVIRPSVPHCSISDMHASACNTRLYVSSMRNEQGNLAAWDHRMAVSQGPLLTFQGHCNAYKPLRFDVDEQSSGGLLAAGGDDGQVRFWSSGSGGQPLSSIDFGIEMPLSVKLVCWSFESSMPRPRPGAWVVTDKQPYTIEIGASAHDAE